MEETFESYYYSKIQVIVYFYLLQGPAVMEMFGKLVDGRVKGLVQMNSEMVKHLFDKLTIHAIFFWCQSGISIIFSGTKHHFKGQMLYE